MYLWVVLATFITILYSYNLSVRADLDRIHAETKAGVVIAKFRAQHNAVKEYLNSQAPDKTGQSRVTYFPGDGFNSTTGADFAKDGSESEGAANYIGEVAKYLPVGYETDSSTVSKVFCLKDGNSSSPQCSSGGGGSCCSDEYMGIYVVSFRDIPSRWFNKKTGMPNADLLGAMVHSSGYGNSIGYLDKIDGKLAISGGMKLEGTTSVDENGNPVENKTLKYREVFEAVKNDADFKRKGCDDPDKHCLFAIQQIYG